MTKRLPGISKTTIEDCIMIRKDKTAHSGSLDVLINNTSKIMDVLKWLEVEIGKIEADERFHYEPANIDTNAPLALIQVTMKTRFDTLHEIWEMLK